MMTGLAYKVREMSTKPGTPKQSGRVDVHEDATDAGSKPARATKKPTPAELLDLLIARAPALHAAGVTSLSIDGLSATLAPPPPPLDLRGTVVPDDDLPTHDHRDALNDPSLYGRGRVPGFKRPSKNEE